jgi:hypothetical protein
MPEKEQIGPLPDPTIQYKEFGRKQELRARYSEQIDSLEKRGEGKAIVGVYYESPQGKKDGVVDEKIVGYVLPLREDNLEHLLILKNGTMMKTHAIPSSDEKINERNEAIYKDQFSPNPASFRFRVTNPKADMYEDIPVIIKGIGKYGCLESIKDPLGDGQVYADLFTKAYRTGGIMKVKEERLTEQRMRRVLEAMEKMSQEDDTPPRSHKKKPKPPEEPDVDPA